MLNDNHNTATTGSSGSVSRPTDGPTLLETNSEPAPGLGPGQGGVGQPAKGIAGRSIVPIATIGRSPSRRQEKDWNQHRAQLAANARSSPVPNPRTLKDFNVLRNECLRRNVLYEDPEFTATNTSLYFSRPPSDAQTFEWKRPGVSLPINKNTDKPQCYRA